MNSVGLDALLKQVKTHLAANPADAAELLTTIASSMESFVRAQQAKRDSLAYNALAIVLEPEWIAEHGVAYSIDAMFHQFPTGPKGHSSQALACWEAFLKLIRKEVNKNEESEKLLENWIAITRSNTCLTWYVNVVKPLL